MSEGGFSYYLEDEKILEYAKLSTAQKLEWLEEMRVFNEAALTPREKRIREFFRNENGEKKINKKEI